ncbi:hypothetical protein BJ322DRAFT_616620 [Thelephora terrestris]|uniref:C2H2-type domain-containing protein n=1 Tax=Thelephora terrestris TaxID=56493 RepID=A0A9P6HIW6_9AGAM|nr:hypothetical protein BJ322DRAFT_616620 [Thelephora terrestris]
MNFQSPSRVPTSLGIYHSRRETSVSPTNSSVWSMPVTPVDSPTAYRVHAYEPYPSSLSDARHLPYPSPPTPYTYYPKPNVTLPPFSTLLPKEDRSLQLFQRAPNHHIRPPTPDAGTPIFHQHDFTGRASSSSLRRPPSALSLELPYAKRRKADPESDQYLGRLEGNKARCMFLLENDPDAGGESGCCAYVARSDMVRRHIRAVHLKLKNNVCRFCKRGFASKGTLETHETLHTGEQPHKCPECEKTFNDPSKRHNHRVNVHGYVPKQIRPSDHPARLSKRKAPRDTDFVQSSAPFAQ